MQSRLLVVSASVGLALVLAAPSPRPAGVCLHGHPSVLFEYDHSDAVLIGRVSGHRAVPESDGYYEGDGYTVRVRELFRCNVPESFEVFSENSSGRFPMQVKRAYLLLLYRERGRLMVDNCGNSGALGESGAAVDTVRQLHRKTPS